MFNNKDKTATALTITILVIGFILWLIFGNTTEHLWSSFLFFIFFAVFIALFTIDWIGYIRNNSFDRYLLITIIVCMFFIWFAGIEIGKWGTTAELWFNIISIIRWIITIAYFGLVLFTAIRTFQELQN